MYQQNAINTYVKYVSIKMLHTYHAMQFVTILRHTIAYQQNARNKYVSTKCQKHICQVCINQTIAYLLCNAISSNTMPYYYISTNIVKYCSNIMTYYAYQQNARNTYAKYVSIKMLHTCYGMKFITILCHTIAYQQNIAKYYSNITCMNDLIQGMVQQIGKSSLLNSQCKIDLVGNGSRTIYFTISATYIYIPKL